MFSLKIIRILEKVSPGSSRSLVWEIINSIVVILASILINRFLGAEDRGLFTLMILGSTTVFVIGGCQWERTLRGLISSQKISGKEAWRRSVYYVFWLSPIFIPIGIISHLFFASLTLEIRILINIYSCIFPFYLLGAFLYSIYLTLGSIDGQYLMRTVMQISYLVFVLILVLFQRISLASLIVIYILLQLIYFMAGWIQKEKLLVGEELSGNPPFSPLIKGFLPNTIETLILNLDIWAFSYFGSLTTLGQYVAITGLMQPISLVSNALTSGSTARLDWTKALLVRRYLVRTIAVMLCLLAISIIGGMIINPYLLELLLGKSFVNGWWMIPWVAGVVVTKVTAIQFHTAIQLSGLQNTYLTIQSLEPILRLVLVLCFAWQLSEFGIFLGLILSSVVKSLICFLLQSRSVSIN